MLVLHAPLARAQEAGAQGRPSLAESLSVAAKDAYESATLLLNLNDPAGALAKYSQAYDLSQDPRLLYNMALCARDLHQYARVQALLLRYERDAGDELPASHKADVDQALATVRNLVGTVHVEANESGASVVIDGEEVGTTPLGEPSVLDLGKHRLSVTKPGFREFAAVIDVSGGQESIVLATMQARGAHLVVRAELPATVIVDRRVAPGPFDGVVPAGTHLVQVTAPGKKPFAATLILLEGETRSLQPGLVNESRPPVLWPWIAGGVAVVAAAAAVSAYVLLQPHDTHPAPTGTFATVNLPPVGR
jgi:hypothetical protein